MAQHNDEQAQAVVTYDDDRRGLMRVHIAQRRGDLACDRYSRNTLRAFARWRMLAPSSLQKRDLATRMAYEGLIDADGYLRDGFPAVVTSPGSSSEGGAS
jgi:hypothetical protein